jgi:hypothetical protein
MHDASIRQAEIASAIATTTPVESSNVAAVGFQQIDSESPLGALVVAFRGGVVGRYRGVPRSVFESLMAAPSKGKFLAAYVRSSFVWERFEQEIVNRLTPTPGLAGDGENHDRAATAAGEDDGRRASADDRRGS